MLAILPTFIFLFVFLYQKFNNIKAIKIATKQKEMCVKQVIKVPEGRPKVK